MKNPFHKRSSVEKILDAAWNLFHQKGYEATTIQDIIRESGTSQGAFYYNFSGKDELLCSMIYHYEECYDVWYHSISRDRSSYDLLIELDDYVTTLLLDSNLDMLTHLYAKQLTPTSGKRYMISENRIYTQILYDLFRQGISSGEFKNDTPLEELVDIYITIERGITYNWCLYQGNFDLKQTCHSRIKRFLSTVVSSKEE